jgi:hypothetical protein
MLITAFLRERPTFYEYDLEHLDKKHGKTYGVYVEVLTGMWHVSFTVDEHVEAPRIMCNFASKESALGLLTLAKMCTQIQQTFSSSGAGPRCEYGRWGTWGKVYMYGAPWDINWRELADPYQRNTYGVPDLPWESLTQLHARIPASVL